MPPTRRRALRLGAVVVAGCAGGALEATDSDAADATSTETQATTDPVPAPGPVGVGSAVPEGSVEFPEGPKDRPERPADLTAERVREYVRIFERRWVYNRLYRGDSTDVHRECGVDSIAAQGERFRVVVWCSAWANSGKGGTTVHADYFTQYATYFVGANSTVRCDGKATVGERSPGRATTE